MMKKFLLITLCVLSFSFNGAVFAQTVDTSSPDGMVKTATQQVLDMIKADPTIKTGDIARVTQIVDEKILPYVDFHRTTQYAMGPAWRTATPAQREQLVEQFKMLLIRTYAGALSQVGNQQIQYKPFRAKPDDTDVVVRSTVINNGQPIELDYRLYKTPQGWRVYDLNIFGAWLIQTYRQQFSEKIQQGGVEGLIQFLVQRNRELAAGKKAS